jgi:hypothetical protein
MTLVTATSAPIVTRESRMIFLTKERFGGGRENADRFFAEQKIGFVRQSKTVQRTIEGPAWGKRRQ